MGWYLKIRFPELGKMNFSAYEIKKIFTSNFPGIGFLEDIKEMEQRYLENGIIIFYYQEAETKIVIKFYSLQNVPDKQIDLKIKSLNREYDFVTRGKHHPNIVNVFRHDKIRVNGLLIGLVMFMEFFPMTLKDLIAKKRVFFDKEIESFLMQMSSALETIHYRISKPIVHCDIKPSNIGVHELVHGKYQYKLLDFDVSMELDERTHHNMTTSSTGYTPGYSSPEQVKRFINREGEITNTIDIYSIGVIALQMHTGSKPVFSTDNMESGLSLNLCAKKWEKVFSRLCSTDPNLRPKTVDQLLYQNNSYSVSLILKISVILLMIVLMATILVFLFE